VGHKELNRGAASALRAACALAAAGGMAVAQTRTGADWQREFLTFPYDGPPASGKAALLLVRQDFEQLQRNRSILKTPLRIGSRAFQHGMGTHAHSCLRLTSPKPMARLEAWVGVDRNERTEGGQGSVVFAVRTDASELWRSPLLRGGMEPVRAEVALDGVRQVDLIAEDGGDGPSCDHADWADATVTFADGASARLDALEQGIAHIGARYPFSFTYGGRPSDELLPGWATSRQTRKLPGGAGETVTRWTDPQSGLVVRLTTVAHASAPAVDWLLDFANEGIADTGLIENVRSADIVLRGSADGAGYRVLRTAGGTPTPAQFEEKWLPLGGPDRVDLGAGAGRSSTQDFPFFIVEGSAGTSVVAVGWSGNWSARLEATDRRQARLTAGLERSRFVLHPGEAVRGPRMLVLNWPGGALEACAQFRQLLHRSYCAPREGKELLPILFSNTCFTRGGGWLNECTAENQISLIKAYAPLGLEAVITDAGWFEGGWPAGAGNWTPRKDAYPDGMAPVAAAAKKQGMVYGLWYEPERVVAGTWLHKNKPEWLLASQDAPEGTYLLNFGLPEVRDYFVGIVKGFMDLPGFSVYRQDFNMDPLPYWRHNDAPDRVGITEMKYVEGIYAYWDRLGQAWPGSIREECASGGHRMDLETLRRFHIHQKTDFWFNNEVDQASLLAVSRYLPTHTVVAPIDRLDEYTFWSVAPSSLCIGWIADGKGFPTKKAGALLKKYLALRKLMVGAYYPLTAYSRSHADWLGHQFHRPDLNEGLVMAYRRAESPYRSIDTGLVGLDPKATYKLTDVRTGASSKALGAELAAHLVITLPEKRSAAVLTYRKVNR
jgi:alpha-galactosidase